MSDGVGLLLYLRHRYELFVVLYMYGTSDSVRDRAGTVDEGAQNHRLLSARACDGLQIWAPDAQASAQAGRSFPLGSSEVFESLRPQCKTPSGFTSTRVLVQQQYRRSTAAGAQTMNTARPSSSTLN